MRVRTLGRMTVLSQPLWGARLLVVVLGLAGVAMAWQGWRQGVSDIWTATMMALAGTAVLLPLFHRVEFIIDPKRRLVTRSERGLGGESRRIAFDDIAEVAVVTQDPDGQVEYGVAFKLLYGKGDSLPLTAFAKREKAEALAAVVRERLAA